MAYTDAAGTPATYREHRNNQTEWDQGLTVWDSNGNNIGTTFWDLAATEYTPATETTPIYTEA